MDNDIFGMPPVEVGFIAIICFVVNIVVLYMVIRSATKSNSRNDILYVQTRLISKLLLQNGVTAEEIKSIVDQGKDSGGDLIQREYSKIIPGMDDEGRITNNTEL